MGVFAALETMCLFNRGLLPESGSKLPRLRKLGPKTYAALAGSTAKNAQMRIRYSGQANPKPEHQTNLRSPPMPPVILVSEH